MASYATMRWIVLLATAVSACGSDDDGTPPTGSGGSGGAGGGTPFVECLAGNRARFRDGRVQSCGDEYVCKPDVGCPSSCTVQSDCMENHQCAKIAGDEIGSCNFIFPG